MKFFLLSFACAAGVAGAATIFSVSDLGSLGGSAAQVFGLNASGAAVGSASTVFGYTHAFSNFGSGLVDLTLNTGAGGGSASGINDSGQVVGTQYVTGQAIATVWTNGAPQAISGAGSFGMGINDSGTTTGMLADGHAFSESNGSVTDIGTRAGNWSAGYSINNSGQIAGYGESSPGVFRGFVWTPSAGFVQLGTLGGAGSYAMAINDAGQVAGNAQNAGGSSHAFLWSGGVMLDLGTLGGSSYGYGINAAGDVVGYSYVNGVQHAFLYEDGVMFDLNNLVDPSSGWSLSAAYAINGSGQIAGSGMFNGVEHAFRLDYVAGYTDVAPVSAQTGIATPEPATWLIAAIGLGLIVSSKLRIRPRLPRQPKDRTRALRR
ncbi:MAG: HAF repeat-containing protein [Acidobacteriia bacterium]|nr:HAF repeat-containing protein [Terriglobia bacterium]